MPFLPDLIVRSQRVVTPAGTRRAAVHVRGGKIAGVLDFDDVPAGCPVDEAGAAAVIPGVVDTYVHVDAFDGAGPRGVEATTRAAAAGGITTIIQAPLGNAHDGLNSSGAATTSAGVAARLSGAEGQCYVDVGLWGGIVPGNAGELARMVDAGVVGFACGLASPNGDAVAEADLRVSMPAITRLNVPLLVHPEAPGPIARAAERRQAGGPLVRLLASRRSRRCYSAYLTSRPKEAENEAIALMIALCQEFRTRIHIVPLSSSDALTPLFHARSARLPITAATSPHHLTFVAEEIPDGGISFKCAPPIRERENREFLWAALAGGLIQMAVSDHARPPDTTKAQARDFRRAWTGISSLAVSLSAMWTGAVGRGYTLNQVTPREEARLAFMKHYAEDSTKRVDALRHKPDPWWEEGTKFFDVRRSKAWVMTRRLTHTSHHRGQLMAMLRMLGHEVYSNYGPTADTGGLMQDHAPTIYAYPTLEALFKGEAAGGAKAALPTPSGNPITERPAAPMTARQRLQ